MTTPGGVEVCRELPGKTIKNVSFGQDFILLSFTDGSIFRFEADFVTAVDAGIVVVREK